LGDKPGPLDRAGQAFTMWNTDAFGWQESTDPIYKSIPFFLNVNHGRTLGVFLDNTWRTNFDFGRADGTLWSTELCGQELCGLEAVKKSGTASRYQLLWNLCSR
jgi:alpha-glucosidase (family GH31 glycosyl hydrolase)